MTKAKKHKWKNVNYMGGKNLRYKKESMIEENTRKIRKGKILELGNVFIHHFVFMCGSLSFLGSLPYMLASHGIYLGALLVYAFISYPLLALILLCLQPLMSHLSANAVDRFGYYVASCWLCNSSLVGSECISSLPAY